MSTPAGVDYLAARFLDVVRRLNAAEAAIGRVRALCDHADLVSPSPSMAVYVAEVRAALDQPGAAVPACTSGTETTHGE